MTNYDGQATVAMFKSEPFRVGGYESVYRAATNRHDLPLHWASDKPHWNHRVISDGVRAELLLPKGGNATVIHAAAGCYN